MSTIGDGRQRQTRRDEQIRRKLEHDLAKRKHRVAPVAPIDLQRFYRNLKATEGSVLALKPLAPLTMPSDTTVVDAAQYMTAYRASCVLVLDAEGAVCGIFTAKDLAFKVVAAAAESGRDLRRALTVSDVMTPNPTCVSIDSSALDALNLMVSHGFRHLPIMDQNGEIAGVLDITRCFYEAMRRLELACESSQQLREALGGVSTGTEPGSSHPSKILSYVEALREHTSGPELGDVFGELPPPISIDFRASVQEAAVAMRRNRTTSILITDKHQSIAGIFTTKDVVLRVLAADIDPQGCSVVRVMTPNPECAPTSMNIQQALRSMHEGRFLNLPIKNDEGEILGVIDILQLTYVTLEHLNGMTADGLESPGEIGGSGGSGVAPPLGESPAWDKFWMSLEHDDANGDAASDAVGKGADVSGDVGGQIDGLSAVYPHGFEDLDLDSQSNISDTELAQFSMLADDDDDDANNNSNNNTNVHAASDFAELRPEDSLSRLGISEPLSAYDDAGSEIAPSSASTQFGAPAFSFKFRAPSGRAHRVQFSNTADVSVFRSLIAAKLSEQDLAELGGTDKFAVSYLDDERDVISITTLDDIHDAIETARKKSASRAEIYLHHPDTTPTIAPKAAETENGVVPMLVGSAAAMMFGFLAWGRK